jgi:glutamate N-acetyltransferase / amino-acid N-acetyltransferase
MGKSKTGKGVTYPEGFLASGLYCGIKKEKVNDLSLLFSDKPCIASGTFTTNRFKSYSLIWSMKKIHCPIQAVIVNSGNANTCNGEENYNYTELIARKLARALKINNDSVLTSSTGTIGKALPYEKILSSIPALISKLSVENHNEAAKGIMTTDRVLKEFQVDTGIKGRSKEVAIGGMTKGAGMINPSMATMLAFITTDAVIDRDSLDAALKEAVEDSFNMITVDNDNSTNDMVVCLANGSAGNKRIHLNTEEYKKFSSSLKKVCTYLARMIASDGEGAGKLIEVRVNGGWCLKDAKRVAKKVAGSNLVKATIYGCLPNWGRILSSIGSTNAKIDTKKIEVSICGVKVYDGNPVKYDEEKLKEMMGKNEIIIDIDLKKGRFSATGWGCDLTEEYVTINKE